MSELNQIEKLIARAVIENTIDQLAIVGGTIQLSLPNQSHQSTNVHQNATNRPLEELILKENKLHQKVCCCHSLICNSRFVPINNFYCSIKVRIRIMKDR
jgi:hypothetical protein